MSVIELLDGEAIRRDKIKVQKEKVAESQINEKYAKGEIRIVTEQARYQLPSIPGMVKSENYILNPEFQRRHRWNVIQKSKLIESFIINVPIPPIFLYEIEYSKYEVMDGLQRLSAISDFYDDKFELTGLEEWEELNGFRYSNLPTNIKRGIDRRYLSSIVLLQETAKSKQEENSLKQLVFNRINSGGVDLTPQESRNALFDGRFNKLCLNLSKSDNFIRLIKLENNEDERFRSMKDVELVLRFFANRQREKFGGSLESYLDFYLIKANSFPKKLIDELGLLFHETVELCLNSFGENGLLIYRPRRNSKKSDDWYWSEMPSDGVYDSLLTVLSGMLDKKDEIMKASKDIQNGLESFYKKHEAIFEGRNVNNADRKSRQEAFFEYILSKI